ncbi:anti-sigma factor [Psychrosphaera ytuae]|uniref:Anti-sigma factor n=1 Tax=Psychrosphaera ytuae TaxID=2820710 RepID=A0A975DAU3_9GAMM|nr:anti-sigma factor [Psychrosphaera ytuae]QTH62891.1 anti-sigma factor [Psychrosphaera ytuae]
MNYNSEKLLDMLAAEYVVGTLQGKARDRYTRLMLTMSAAREATWKWEQQMNNLASSIQPVVPSPDVWSRINQSIGGQDDTVFSFADAQSKQQKAPDSSSTSKTMWKLLTMFATAACLVLAFLVLQPVTPPDMRSTVQQVAVFHNDKDAPLWFIDVTEQKLSILATKALVPEPNKDYELWMIIEGQDNPISLGLLPKSGRVELAKNQLFDVDKIAVLAVSLEPLGGSQTGLPTDVLYTTKLAVL